MSFSWRFYPKRLTIMLHSYTVDTARRSNSGISVLLKDTSTKAGIEPPTPWLKDGPPNHWSTVAPLLPFRFSKKRKNISIINNPSKLVGIYDEGAAREFTAVLIHFFKMHIIATSAIITFTPVLNPHPVSPNPNSIPSSWEWDCVVLHDRFIKAIPRLCQHTTCCCAVTISIYLW